MSFLYDYQYDAVRKMKKGCILNGGVGSGKSRTALYFYFTLYGGKIDDGIYKRMTSPKDLYIITTARKRDTAEWDNEMSPFLLTDELYSNNKFVVDSWNNIGKYKEITGAFFIFDEDRVIGKGEWVKSFLKIARVNYWVILSATPGDTWKDYIPVFVANGFYRNRTEFTREHIIFSSFTSWPQIKGYVNEKKLYRLRDSILVNMDFERSTVRHHETIWTDYDRLMYKNTRKNRWDPIKNEPIETPPALCYCLRRIVNSDESRIEAVKKIMEEKHRAIIFYNYDYELGILLQAFDNGAYSVAEWNGHVHQKIPDDNNWVYLVQYAAGAEGWNCITTDTIIFYSENYSYRMMEQAAGRIDRVNTTYIDLWYYHLKSHADIDLAISRALEHKKDFNLKKFTEKFYSKGEKK